ncbi:ubiquitin conjugating enzyme 1 [Parasitella parasitica]|nr:ubiquitin conjugating enzyme 1 [Parasitella parasitica]
MPANMQKRILNEIKDVYDDETANLLVYVPDETNIYNLYGSIPGPPETPYRDGIFLLDIKLHENHPFTPPDIKFITRVFHPNVSSQTGAICLDVLKSNWSPAMTLRLILMSIQALLESPDPSSPQDFEVAEVFTSNKSAFLGKAEKWVSDYANISLNDYINSLFDD